jgi:hypothetical protein
MKLEFSRQIYEESSNITCYQNPFTGSRVVPCGQTDMAKLRVAFLNFPDEPTNGRSLEVIRALYIVVFILYNYVNLAA